MQEATRVVDGATLFGAVELGAGPHILAYSGAFRLGLSPVLGNSTRVLAFI